MDSTLTLAAVRPLLDKMAFDLLTLLRESITPISALRGEQTVQLGTGTFFRVADESFLVSASHVWEEAGRYGFGKELCVFDPDRSTETGVTFLRPVGLLGKLYRVKEPLDVAILHLDDKAVDQLKHVRFLRLDQVGVRPRRKDRCWVVGFPHESLKDMPAQSQWMFNPFVLLAPFYEGPVALENYDPKVHFLLDAARDDLWELDGTPANLGEDGSGRRGTVGAPAEPSAPHGHAHAALPTSGERL
jgi:hypothetical protein